MNSKKVRYKGINSISDLRLLASNITENTGPAKVAVAWGNEPLSLSAINLATQKKLIEPIMYGSRRKIEESLSESGISGTDWEINNFDDPVEATIAAIKSILNGQNSILMRGEILVRDFFTTLFDKANEVHFPGEFWSVVSIVEIEGVNRLVILSDCALTINTDLSKKLEIIKNACALSTKLGNSTPKIALLAAAEAVSPSVPVSLEVAIIAKMSERGQFPEGVMVEGPLSLDLALNKEAVKKKKMKNPVAGNADILIVDNINIGNGLYKSLVTLCGARAANAVIGPPFPIVLTSRSERPDHVLDSIALNILLAQ